MYRLRCIDLFAGIGGIRLGFDQAFDHELDTVFVCENNAKAVKTYTANFHDSFEVAGDIRKVDERDIPPFDICLAGFPCVAFSALGHRLGFKDLYHGDNRGILFMDVVRICEYHKPKVIFCENVKALLTHDDGHTFAVIQEAFEALGYRMFYQVLDSVHYGVPQTRSRVYMVCFRNDIAPDMFVFPSAFGKRKCLNDILEDAPISPKYFLSQTYVDCLKRRKAEHVAKGNGFGYIVRDLNSNAGALLCGGNGHEHNLIVDKRGISDGDAAYRGEMNSEYLRKMTPREWMRLQGFPDDYKIVVSDTDIYRQLGNSVTVPVIRAIAEYIRDVLVTPSGDFNNF